ncbi:hypothetical protein BI347_22175 [Chromobacterium sphagni]|uniref:Uncharacterized protein n=2 Tax=Chromobacterium sphagni TaxID=1903179 RepID=A0A1S1WTH5_9NEIS|nr:hypothetical protein BI347_22175 [Chromobacterium sphagni]
MQESGAVEADVAYIRQLPTLAMRKAELKRLGRVHGDGYAWDVRRALDGSAEDERLAPLEFERHADPRAAALSAIAHAR